MTPSLRNFLRCVGPSVGSVSMGPCMKYRSRFSMTRLARAKARLANPNPPAELLLSRMVLFSLRLGLGF